MRLRVLVLIAGALAMMMALAACGSSGQSQSSGGKHKAPTKMTKEAKKKQVAPKKGKGEAVSKKKGTIVKAPKDKTFKLTIPAMKRVKDSVIPTATGTDEAALKYHTAIHLKGTGFPWQKVSNTYIAGHRLGYRGTKSLYAFYDLNKLKKGDKIYITDAKGRKYTYKVFREETVSPRNLSVTKPIKGENIVTLQSCTLPNYTRRLIIQGKLVSS